MAIHIDFNHQPPHDPETGRELPNPLLGRGFPTERQWVESLRNQKIVYLVFMGVNLVLALWGMFVTASDSYDGEILPPLAFLFCGALALCAIVPLLMIQHTVNKYFKDIW